MKIKGSPIKEAIDLILSIYKLSQNNDNECSLK